MPFVKIWIHVIWATKNRLPLLAHDIRRALFNHIREYALVKNIQLDFINGYVDHVHLLLSLQGSQAVSTVVGLLKGESSHWFNQQGFISDRLEWQDEYIAVSVSKSHIGRVRTYIETQEEIVQ